MQVASAAVAMKTPATARKVTGSCAPRPYNGVIARLPGREVWMAFFQDSEGNTLALMQETPV